MFDSDCAALPLGLLVQNRRLLGRWQSTDRAYWIGNRRSHVLPKATWSKHCHKDFSAVLCGYWEPAETWRRCRYMDVLRANLLRPAEPINKGLLQEELGHLGSLYSFWLWADESMKFSFLVFNKEKSPSPRFMSLCLLAILRRERSILVSGEAVHHVY